LSWLPTAHTAKPVSKPVSKPVGGIGNKGKSTSAPIFSTNKHKEEVKAKRVSKMDSKEIAASVQGKSSC